MVCGQKGGHYVVTVMPLCLYSGTFDRVVYVTANRKMPKRKREAFTAGERTVSDRDSPSRSVTRLLDRKLLTGVTCGEGAGSTVRTRKCET